MIAPRRSIRVPAERLKLVFVSSYYDHPLAGVCVINGAVYRFSRELYSRWATVTELSAMERIWLWMQRTVFGICVGWHYHYKNNVRVCNFRWRRPKLLHAALFNLYYWVRKQWR